jgi:hypothetical protein
MDERDIEEEGKDREGKGWGIRIEKVILFGNICNCYFKFIYVYIVTRNQKIKHLYSLREIYQSRIKNLYLGNCLVNK